MAEQLETHSSQLESRGCWMLKFFLFHSRFSETCNSVTLQTERKRSPKEEIKNHQREEPKHQNGS